jgi:hypothetical protein
MAVARTLSLALSLGERVASGASRVRGIAKTYFQLCPPSVVVKIFPLREMTWAC